MLTATVLRLYEWPLLVEINSYLHRAARSLAGNKSLGQGELCMFQPSLAWMLTPMPPGIIAAKGHAKGLTLRLDAELTCMAVA